MTNNNYYTPELGDFYVGYECEIKNSSDKKYFEWEFCKFKEDFSNQLNEDYCFNYLHRDLKEKNIRTKYLDNVDIKSLGFKYKETIRDGQYFTKNNLGLIYIKEDNILMIYKVIEGINQNEMLFQGNCKSINELKKIIKYLGY